MLRCVSTSKLISEARHTPRATKMATFDLNFTDLKSINPALQGCSVATAGSSWATPHIVPLTKLASQLKAIATARRNMEYYAAGYEDLAIILMEPSDREDELSHEDLMSCQRLPYAVRRLDESLRFATRRSRNIRNTAVLDVRPLRSRKLRDKEDSTARMKNGAAAYAAIRTSLNLLNSKVIVVCHCDKDGLQAGMPPYLYSSITKAGEKSLVKLENGHSCLKLFGFHPTLSSRTLPEQVLKRLLLDYLFDAIFIIMANHLNSRSLRGSGLVYLRDSILKG